MVCFRPVIATLALAAILLASCGQDTVDSAPTTPPVASPTGQPQVPLPAGWPDAFPQPPPDTPIASTELIENALSDPEDDAEAGTAVHRTVRYRYGNTGADADAERLLDHYRTALPEAGWNITGEETFDEDSPAARPGYRLQIEGHGHTLVRLTIEQHDDYLIARATISDVDQDRAPYSMFPPSIPMPAWYAELPPPPEETRRYRITVTHDIDDGESFMVEYVDDHVADNLEGRAETVIDHYRRTLPASGWDSLHEEDETEHDEGKHGTVERRRLAIRIAGRGVSATISARQSTDFEGRWLSPGLTITVGPG